MPDIARIQQEIKAVGADGWLFYDFRNRDQIAYQILGLDFGKFTTRRWFYYIPASGEPVRVVSAVEAGKLDPLPGRKIIFRSWRDLHDGLKNALGGARKVAMQYSPMGNIPYVSIVDAGTVELLRSFGYEIVSSALLVQTFQAVLSDEALATHVEAGRRVQKIKDEAFARIGSELRAGRTITPYDVQQFIARRFVEDGLDCLAEYPIVGTNEQPADPHFEPTPENARPIKQGDTVLIDLWAKLAQPGSIFYDITWCGFVGDRPPAKYVEIWRAVCAARDAALALVQQRIGAGQPLFGWEVDDASRAEVEKAGYGEQFVHRTGHSIGETVHWNGVNIDNLETMDERLVVPGVCFSIEPGIYLAGEMAARTEINVFVTHDGKVNVAGPVQRALIRIDA